MVEGPIPLEELPNADDIKEAYHHSKAFAITRSTMAIISLISSSFLIWLIAHSKHGLSSTYHRIVLGMSIADIFLSLSLAPFNATAPSDVDYIGWNARGNQASCSAEGFLGIFGGFTGVYYSCSLNIYYLAVVRYQKTDRYIRNKIEPFLHGTPLGLGLIVAITLLVKQNLNSLGGICQSLVYDPPHCIGYKDGEIREGFTIPCGRGRDGAVTFAYLANFITFLIVPCVIVISLGMIYRGVRQQEKKMARYGAGALVQGANDSNEGDPNSYLSNILRRKTKSIKRSNSRVVLQKAFAYTCSYCLTWSWWLALSVIGVAGAEAEVTNVILYLLTIFTPLQGSWNLFIFIYPKVIAAKAKGSDVTWWQAFVSVIFSTRKSPNNTQKGRGRKKDEMGTRPAQQPVDAEEGPNEVEEPHGRSSALHGSPNADENVSKNGSIDDDSIAEERQQLQKTELYFKSIESDWDCDD